MGHPRIVRLLVDADADKDAHDKNAGNAALIFTSSYSGATPLFAACRRGHVEIARLLMEAGAAMDVP